MTLVRHTDRSWKLTWTFSLFVVLALIVSMAVPSIAKAMETDPAYRIVDVRSEQGQLVVEAQHFYPNGNHWFYKLYSWQGREAYKYPRVTNEAGEMLLEDGTVAPYRAEEGRDPYQYIGYDKITFVSEGDNAHITYKVIDLDNTYGNLQTAYFGLDSTKEQVLQYQGQPDRESDLVWEYRNGPDWKRHDYPFLDEASILQIISESHKTSLVSNWTGDQGRTILSNYQFNSNDQSGSKDLVERFEYLAFTYVETEVSISPPFEQLYNRESTPKTFTIEGEDYSGDTSVLPPIQPYFEIIDLRTKDSKTYAIGNQHRTTVIQDSVHYETAEGNWENSSLRFQKVTDEDIWVMSTHPSYVIYGTPNHISMLTLEGEVGARWYTPSTITYEEDTAWYEYDGVRWTYALTNSSIKLTSEALDPRGPKDYSFVFLPLGSANPLRIDASGNATTSSEYDLGDLGPDGAFFYDDEYAEFTGPKVVVPRSIVIGADGVEYIAGAWEIVDDYTIKFAFDDNSLPAQAFPYVIDPTTVIQHDASSGDDAQIRSDGEANTNYGSATQMWLGDQNGAQSRAHRDLIRFDLSSIPVGSIITDTILSIWEYSATDDPGIGSWTANVYRVKRAWVESQVTWNNYTSASTWGTAGASHADDRDSNVSATLSGIDGTSFNGFLHWPGGKLTEDVQSYVNGDLTNNGWIVEATAAENQGANTAGSGFYTMDASASNRPKLTVTYAHASISACQATTATFYPDTHAESTSVDGNVTNSTATSSWSTKRAGPGTTSSDTTADIQVTIGTWSGTWDIINRGIFLFDTVSLPDDAVIINSTVGFVAIPANIDYWNESVALVGSNPNSNTGLVAGDWTTFDFVRKADDIEIADVQDDSITFNYFHLNAAGRSHIDLGGISKFGIVIGADTSDVAPALTGNNTSRIKVASADEAEPTDVRPKLTVNYITPCAALTGTVSDSSTNTFYPDSGTGSDTVDGLIQHASAGGGTWAGYRGSGSTAFPTMDMMRVQIHQHASIANEYREMGRSVVLFDTSLLGAGAVVSSAVLGLVALSGGVIDQFSDSLAIVTSNPALNTNLVAADYTTFGTTLQAATKGLGTFTADSSTFTDIALNAAGIATVEAAATGITKLGLRNERDRADDEPFWVADNISKVQFASADEVLTGDKRPRLVVTHGNTSVALIDASTITAGGKTIILTLNGAHWRPAGSGAGEFDATRQNIIDGIDGSHGAGASNWNEAVRDDMNVSEVTRTSDTVVTILLAAHTAYAPATTETITATINEGVTNPAVTFEPPLSTDDGYVLYQASAASGWPPLVCNLTSTAYGNATYHGYGGNYNMANTVMRWNTATLPDDVEVVSAELRVYVTAVLDNDSVPGYVYGEWYDFDGSVGCDNGGNWPPVGDAFTYLISTSDDDRYITIPLSDLDEVNLADYTGLRLSMYPAPVTYGADLSWTTQGDDVASGSAPQLIVTYSRSTDSNVEITSNPVFLIDPVPFSFDTFTPTITSIGSSFNITVNGTGMPEHAFAGSEDVRLIKGGQSDIVCTSVSGTGGSSVVASCNVTSAVVGTWDVKVTGDTGLTDTKSAALTLFESWSSTVNGGSFSESGSDYAVFAHDATPYFTVTALDEVDKIWGTSTFTSSPPAAAGKDAQFTSHANGKDRIVVGTAANANYLWAYEFDKATGIISGTPPNPTSVGSIGVNALDIGVGDNIVVAATTDTAGVYMYDIDEAAAIASFWTSTIAAPASPPGASCNAVDINTAATFVAVGCSTSPYLHVWAVANGASGTPTWSSKSAATTGGNIPSGSITGIKFSPDGSHIAIATDTSPYMEVYPFSAGTVGTKITTTALPGAANGVAWLNENTAGPTNLAASHAVSPYLTVYNFNTSTSAFGTKLADPSPALAAATTSVGFHPNDDTIFVGQSASPYVTAYNFTGTSDDDYRTYRYMANFGSSYLPDDAVITAATLSLYGDSVNGVGWQLLFEDGTSSTEPLIKADYDYTKYSTQLTASGHTPTTGWNNITLNAAGIAAISKTGITQILIRHEDDIGGSAPTVVETMDIETGGSGTFPTACKTSTSFAAIYADSDYNLCNSANVPKLTLTYTSVSLGAPGTVSVNWTNSSEAALAPTNQTYHIEAFAKGTVLGLRNGTVEAVVPNRALTDVSNTWDFWTATSPNKPFPYTEYLKYDVAGVNQLWYQLDSPPTYYYPDRSGNVNHSTSMSFPLADNITVLLDSLKSSGEALVPDVSGISNPSLLGNISDTGDNISGNSKFAYGDPLAVNPGWTSLFDRASVSMGLSTNTILGVMILFISVVLGIGAYITTGNPIITVVGCSLALMAGVTLGVFPIYFLVMFVVVGLATVGISRSV